MKIIIIGTLLLISGLSCRGDKQTAEEKKQVRQGSMVPNTFDSISQYHCNILDSAAKNPPKDTMYHCCYNSVNFMEATTGIAADVEGDYAGATGFKKTDLQKWHQWYDSAKSVR